MELTDYSNIGFLQHAQRMIEKNVDINTPLDEDNFTLLHHAVTNGNLNLVRLLIRYGANVKLRTTDIDAGPLSYAGASRTADTYHIYKLLLKKGADWSAPDTWGLSPIICALAHQPLTTVQLLLDYGADIKAVTGFGTTALHAAATNRHVDVVEFVLGHGFDVDCRQESGTSALHHAASSGCPEVCQLLLQHGAPVNAKDKKSNTPLFLAVKRSRFELSVSVQVIEILLEHGSDMNVEGSKSVLKIATGERYDVRTRSCLVRHVARIHSFRLNVCEKDQQIIEKEACYKTYYEQCLQEFERMKETKFYNDMSVFTVFMGSDKVVSGYSRNEELLQALEKMDYAGMFPIYFSWLKKRFYAAVEKQKLLKYLATSLANLFKLSDPFHPVIHKILSYKGNGDLKCLDM